MDRLEEIKLAIENARVAGRLFIDMDLGDASYLISRVGELQAENERLREELTGAEERERSNMRGWTNSVLEVGKLRKENERLRAEQEKASWDFVAVEPDWGPQE